MSPSNHERRYLDARRPSDDNPQGNLDNSMKKILTESHRAAGIGFTSFEQPKANCSLNHTVSSRAMGTEGSQTQPWNLPRAWPDMCPAEIHSKISFNDPLYTPWASCQRLTLLSTHLTTLLCLLWVSPRNLPCRGAPWGLARIVSVRNLDGNVVAH